MSETQENESRFDYMILMAEKDKKQKTIDDLTASLEALIVYYEQTKNNRIAWSMINEAKAVLAKAKGN